MQYIYSPESSAATAHTNTHTHNIHTQHAHTQTHVRTRQKIQLLILNNDYLVVLIIESVVIESTHRVGRLYT